MTAIEVVTGRVVNPGAAFTALTVNTGQTFSVRDFPDSMPAYLEGVWTQQATAGQVRVRSPRLHDDTQGMRFIAPAATVRNFLADEAEQKLFPNDPLRFEMTGGAAETDSAALLFYYRDLGGVAARLSTWEELKPRIVDIMGQEVDVAGPVTAGDWSAGVAVNATNDNLKADTDYAILGYGVSAECLALAVSGTDTGNLKVGGPAPADPLETRDWFVSMAKRHGTPHIPVFNSNNRGNTLVSIARNTAAGTVNTHLVLARLAR